MQLESVRSDIISATISGKWTYNNKEQASLMTEEATKEVRFTKSLSVEHKRPQVIVSATIFSFWPSVALHIPNLFTEIIVSIKYVHLRTYRMRRPANAVAQM